MSKLMIFGAAAVFCVALAGVRAEGGHAERRAGRHAVAFLPQGLSYVIASRPPSLCGEDEEVIFSCPVRGVPKTVSLCASKRLGKNDGYLRYRFGRAGAVELDFPKERREGPSQFRYAHYFRARVDRTEISFENDGYGYSLYDYYEGERRPATREQGVRITPPGGRGEVVLKCRGAATSNLGVLSDVVPCDKDNPLNMGDCP